MKNATKYLVVGSLGVLMTRRDISSLAVKGLKQKIVFGTTVLKNLKFETSICFVLLS